MRKVLLALALISFLWAGAATAQHRNPNPPPPSAPPQTQPAQPAPPQQAQPRASDDQAKPRQAPPRDAHDQPRQGPAVVPYPGWPWWGYPYPYGYPPYGEFKPYAEWETAKIRIAVSPNDAQVYVDGFYAGGVNDFDGIFEHLTLQPGAHLIEIRKIGYVPLAFDLYLYPGQSVTYRRSMEPGRDDVQPPIVRTPGFEEGAAPPSPDQAIGPPGEIRFDVEPDDAAIYVDGFYMGIADDFSGSQRLQLPRGHHHLSLELKGYVTKEVELTIESEHSVTYRAELQEAK